MAGMKLLLFDVDGTILLTNRAGIRSMEQAGRELFGERFDLSQVSVAGALDPLIYAEATRLAGIDNAATMHDAFRDRYLEILQASLDANGGKTVLLPGIGAVVETLRNHETVSLGVVTGNYTAVVPIKLRAVGLDPAWFPFSAFGDEGPDRPSLVRIALERYQQRAGRPIAAADVIVIGDTPHDVTCAHANGCLCFAVATGMYTADDLRGAGADVVVSDLRDPAPLHAMLECC